MIGNLHLLRHEWTPARKKYEHIAKMTEKAGMVCIVWYGANSI